jgi:uncharacterized protein (TIGR02246 family)
MNDDELEIRDLVNAWLRATEAHEDHKILDLMDDEAIFLAAGQPMIKGKRTFGLALETMKDLNLETSSRIQEIKVSGDMAYCWNHLSVTLKPKVGRNMVKRTGNVLSILEKKDGRWRITRDANMLAAVE